MAEISPEPAGLVNRWSVAVAVAAVAVLLFYLLQPILLPFVLGALVAYLGDPLVDMLARRRISRTLGVAIVFFVFSALVTIACVLALPLLLHQLDLLLVKIPVMYSWLTQETLPWIQRKFDLPLERLPQLNWSGQLADHWQSLGKFTAQTLVKISGSARRLLLVRVADEQVIERFGIDHYYQLYVFTKDSQTNPLVFCLREIPKRPVLSQFLAPQELGAASRLILTSERMLDIGNEILRPMFEPARREGLLQANLDLDSLMEWVLRILMSYLAVPGPATRTEEDLRGLLREMLLPAVLAGGDPHA